jgi:hypothetical protein
MAVEQGDLLLSPVAESLPEQGYPEDVRKLGKKALAKREGILGAAVF